MGEISFTRPFPWKILSPPRILFAPYSCRTRVKWRRMKPKLRRKWTEMDGNARSSCGRDVTNGKQEILPIIYVVVVITTTSSSSIVSIVVL